MKITKLVHSCLLVEMPERTVLFDPGAMSVDAIDGADLKYLDDIIITHEHADHMDLKLIRGLVDKFPDVRVFASSGSQEKLAAEGIDTQMSVDGIVPFEAPHEAVEPLFKSPDNVGVHYLGMLTHPGDSHHFNETMPILALPVTAPWGATVTAFKLAVDLKPKCVIPIHDWHWRDEAREQMYENLEEAFAKHDITFIKAKNGEPFTI